LPVWVGGGGWPWRLLRVAASRVRGGGVGVCCLLRFGVRLSSTGSIGILTKVGQCAGGGVGVERWGGGASHMVVPGTVRVAG